MRRIFSTHEDFSRTLTQTDKSVHASEQQFMFATYPIHKSQNFISPSTESRIDVDLNLPWCLITNLVETCDCLQFILHSWSVLLIFHFFSTSFWGKCAKHAVPTTMWKQKFNRCCWRMQRNCELSMKDWNNSTAFICSFARLLVHWICRDTIIAIFDLSRIHCLC